MITKQELRREVDLWRTRAVAREQEINKLYTRLEREERYSHVNEDMALSLAKSHEVIGQMSTTISTIVQGQVMKGGH